MEDAYKMGLCRLEKSGAGAPIRVQNYTRPKVGTTAQNKLWGRGGGRTVASPAPTANWEGEKPVKKWRIAAGLKKPNVLCQESRAQPMERNASEAKEGKGQTQLISPAHQKMGRAFHPLTAQPPLLLKKKTPLVGGERLGNAVGKGAQEG